MNLLRQIKANNNNNNNVGCCTSQFHREMLKTPQKCELILYTNQEKYGDKSIVMDFVGFSNQKRHYKNMTPMRKSSVHRKNENRERWEPSYIMYTKQKPFHV